MSQEKTQIPEPESERTVPAVGVVATGANDEAVSRVILRARSRGHTVFVTHPAGVTPAVGEWVSGTDVRVVPPVADPDVPGSAERVQERLVSAARGASAPGIIVVEDPSRPVSFDPTVETFDESDDYAVTAVPEGAQSVGTAVAIPAYNEADTIGDVVAEAMEGADEVIVVDDGSADETARRAADAGATVISHDRNRGYGAALMTAFETAVDRDVDRLVTVDGDGQHDPEDIETLAEVVAESEANVAIGSRFAGESPKGMPRYRRFGLLVVNTMMNVSLGNVLPGSWIRDTQSGFRAYDSAAIESVRSTDGIGADMDASLDILYHLQKEGFDIEERPTVIDYEIDDSSSHHPLRHGLQLVSTILWTVERKHPVLLLGTPGVLITLGGLAIGYVTAIDYVSTGTFPLGTALAAVFATLLGVFACFTAIVLHSLQAHLGD